jgi:hypothetical protein
MLNDEVLSNIQNKDFLRVSRDSRLEHVSKPKISALELKE